MDPFSFKSIIEIVLVTELPFCFCLFVLFVVFFKINECTASSILLVHTTVFAILGTLITRKDAQVRKVGREMSLGSIEHRHVIARGSLRVFRAIGIWRKPTYPQPFASPICQSFLLSTYLSYWTQWDATKTSGFFALDLIETLLIFAADINECTSSPSAFHVNAQCTNTIGSYRFVCNPGYTGNGKTYTGT